MIPWVKITVLCGLWYYAAACARSKYMSATFTVLQWLIALAGSAILLLEK